MSNGFTNVRGLPPVEAPGKILKSTVSGSEWGDLPPVDDTTLPDRLDSIGPIIVDFNAPKASGWYRANNAVNGPAGATPYGMLFHQEWDGANGHASQLFTPMYDAGGVLWLRISNTYVWQPWKKVYPIDDTNLPNRLKGQTGVVPITDANNAQEAGWYGCNTGAANLPVPDTPCHLEVYTWDIGGNVIVQFCHAMNGERTWKRWKWGSWSAWILTWPISAYVLPTPIPEGNLPSRLLAQSSQISDWNAVFNSGWYCGNGAANSPPSGITQWYGMMVNWSTAGYGMQTVYALSGSAEIWERNLIASVWQAWQKVYPPPASAITINDTNLPQRIQGAHTYVASLDGQWEAGWYAFTPSTTGIPIGAYGFCHVLNLGAGNVLQLAYQYNASTAWMRRKIDGGAWGAWVQTWPLTTDKIPVLGDAHLRDSLTSDGQHGTDPNSMNQGGFYNANAFGNGPDGGHWHYMVCAHSTGYFFQIAVNLYSDVMKMRRCVGGSFGSWVQIYPSTGGDSGWVNITSFGSQTGALGGWQPQARKFNGVVYLRGLVQTWESENEAVICSVGSGYRNGAGQKFRVATGSGDGTLTVYGDGNIVFDGTFPASSWISLSDVHYIQEN